ncbi:unnamed protein product [Toxocara canis]|uniref:Transposase n=1 Tax=Toxocara canis TaxID=6265 RepID=A0A183U4Q7_TOXCA|nr:unnamed protein product [Toxocara canis]
MEHKRLKQTKTRKREIVVADESAKKEIIERQRLRLMNEDMMTKVLDIFVGARTLENIREQFLAAGMNAHVIESAPQRKAAL